ncbi:MAG TPA: ABC transporter substrate-binding protein [Planctomycetota bacterium]|jgi:iron complex transport system substrate-binding protein|nr:ABC transporter substrate-binding protein [Planctomycetota bacterium]
MHTPPGPRIASLLPSATEIVCALGMAESLVGRSHECDYPPEVGRVPSLTSARIGKPGADSAAIDRDIRQVLRDGLAVYDIDVEGLARAAPDFIVTQDLCEVCAVSLSDVRAAARTLANPAVEIVNLRPMRLADILDDVRRVGAALARTIEADAVVRDLEARIEAVRARAVRGTRPRRSVLTVEWLDPVMIGGTWMPELVEIAGGRALVTRSGDHAPTLAREELARLAPEVVLVKPCGFPLARTELEIGAFVATARALGWPAARTGDVWIADGHSYFNRPGPRIVDSLEILAACLDPQEFSDFAAKYANAFRRAGGPG